MKALAQLYVAVETLVHRLVGQAAVRTGAQREALLAEAIAALDTLAEAALVAPELVEDEYYTSALEAMPEGAPLPEVEPDVIEIGQALEGQLVGAAETAQERSRWVFPAVTAVTVEQAAHDAVTGLVDAAGHRLTIGPYAEAVTSHAGRRAATAGLLAGLPDSALVRFSSHRSTHPVCKPLEGKTFPVETAPRPPMHPGCGHRLEPV